MLTPLVGCGAETDTGSQPEPPESSGGGSPGCPPGEIEDDDGRCQPAGLPADLPPAGPTEPLSAGVAPEQCAPGFDPDGEGGCDPILPADPCPAGTMALPGETECREVAPCGQGSWGDIPVEADTQYVDQGFAGTSDGSADHPWTTIQQGVDAAAPGAMVAVAAGSYPEDVLVADKAVRLWGRCPALTEIAGVGADEAVLVDDAAGSEIRAVAVRGDGYGVMVQRSASVLLEALWVHDTGSHGIVLLRSTDGVLQESLVEAASVSGVEVVNAEAIIDRTVVRDTQPSSGHWGRGVDVNTDPITHEPSAVVVSGSVIENNRDFGVAVVDSNADVRSTVIRDTQPNAGVDLSGVGLLYENHGVRPATGAVTAAVVQGNTLAGILVLGSRVSIDATTVRDCVPDAAGFHGWGIEVRPGAGGSAESRPELIVRDSLVDQAYSAGVLGNRSDVTLEGVAVRDIDLTPANGLGGYGVYVGASSAESGTANLSVDSCLVDRSHHAGIALFGASATIEETIVRGTRPLADGRPAIGILATTAQEDEVGSVVALRSSLIEGTQGVGMIVKRSTATVLASVIRDTQPVVEFPEAGAGMIVHGGDAMAPTRAVLDGSVIERNHTFGIVLAGSDIVLRGTVVRDTQASAGDFRIGRGLELQPAESGMRATASVHRSSIESSRDSGVAIWSGDLVLEGSVVEDTLESSGDGDPSAGVIVSIAVPLSEDRSNVVIRGSVVRRSSMTGVLVRRSDSTIESTVLSDTAPSSADGRFGRCVEAQFGATLSLSRSVVERCHEIGLLLIGSDAHVTDTVIRDIQQRASDGLIGDGVAVVRTAEGGTLDLLRAQVERATRVGISTFGCPVSLAHCTLECNLMDLDAELVLGTPGLFTDGGGNWCGCDGEQAFCAVTSAQLAPPEPTPLPR